MKKEKFENYEFKAGHVYELWSWTAETSIHIAIEEICGDEVHYRVLNAEEKGVKSDKIYVGTKYNYSIWKAYGKVVSVEVVDFPTDLAQICALNFNALKEAEEKPFKTQVAETINGFTILY